MIHVSCGSYQSTSLEIFLNFFQCLSLNDQSKYLLHCNINLLDSYALKSGCSTKGLNIFNLESNTQQICSASVNSILDKAKSKDIMLTLPASKADLVFENKQFLGHTEYLRHLWKIPHLPMAFVSPKFLLLLLTDHIPLNKVAQSLSQANICLKVTTFLNHSPMTKNIKRLIFWGVNPHAGENGQLGEEEKELTSAINILRLQFPQYEILGPLPSDGQFNYKFTNDAQDLIISSYHDQGLVFLKSNLGFLSTNVTFGGPVIRVSPDHGTAANLLYKKQALYTSLLWTHELVKSWAI